MKSGSANSGITRRSLLGGGMALSSCTVLGGVGDRLLANRSLADFISGVPGRAGWRDRINQGLAECAAAGMAVTGSAGDYPLDGPLHIPAGLKMTCEPGCVIRRAYDDRGYRNALLLTAGDQSRNADGFEWVGGEFRPMDATLGNGNLATLFGYGWTFRNAVMRDWRGGQCFIFGGGGFQLRDVDARSMQREFVTGTYRCVWNDERYPSSCVNLFGMGGDDIFQAAPIAAANHPRFGLDIVNLTYENCEGYSHSSRLIVAIVMKERASDRITMPSQIRNCTWRNVRGRGAHHSVVISNSFGDVAKGSMIDNILLENCDIDCSREDGKAKASVRIFSDRAGIGAIALRNCRITGSKTPALLTASGVGSLTIEGETGTLQGEGDIIRAGFEYPVGDVTLRKIRLAGGRAVDQPVKLRMDGKLIVEDIAVEGQPAGQHAVKVVRGGTGPIAAVD
jgi:hypothetical protein